MASLLKYYTVGVETRQLKTPSRNLRSTHRRPRYTTQMYKVQSSCPVGDICLNFDANPKGEEARIDKFAPLRVTGIVPFQRLVMTEH